MSKSARALLSKMQGYCQTVEYDMGDVEWFAHSFTISLLVSWWKRKKENEGMVGSVHTWYLPVVGSEEYRGLVAYIISKGNKIKQVDLDWTNNHKQVYHYLCANILECDFNFNEFKAILDIGSEFNIQEVQQAADKTRGVPGGSSIAYISATLQRNKQNKDTKVRRISEAISDSQKSFRKISTKRSSTLDVVLMKRAFVDTKETQEVARRMDEISKSVRGHRINQK